MSRTSYGPAEWDCPFCGSTGSYRPGEHPDGVQCPDCGEVVVPR
jgi:predicted RNA-binding Zn-ribbon protein involved in translation (DUF1610 family)